MSRPLSVRDGNGYVGQPLGEEIPEFEPQPISDTPERRAYPFKAFKDILQREGRPLSPLKTELVEFAGCVGLGLSMAYTDEQIVAASVGDGAETITNSGKLELPFRDSYVSFKRAHREYLKLEQELSEAGAGEHAILIGFQFEAGSPDKFQPQGGRIDMSGYDPEKSEVSVIANFDTGVWDEATKSVWHADQGSGGSGVGKGLPPTIYQSTLKDFQRQTQPMSRENMDSLNFPNPREVWMVARTSAFDATR